MNLLDRPKAVPRGLSFLFVVALFCAGVEAEDRCGRSEQEAEEEEEEFFEPDTPAFSFRSVWDFRFARTDETTSWLEAGLGKTRYGGEDGSSRHLFRIAQAAFVFSTNPERALAGHVHVNLDLEPEHPEGRYGWDRLRLIESFVTGEWAFAEPLVVRVKAGLFFPPISLEHIGEGWTTFYTLTPSALNAWVGEEVRTLGSQLSVAHVGIENELALGGAVFWHNDPTGSLLAYRGFASHDRQTGLRDRVPLAPLPSIRPGGEFEGQAPWVEPVVELDSRAGYFGTASWENYRFFQLRAIYFDNRGIPDTFESSQYAWRTRFLNAGAVVFLPGEAELVGQYLDGDTFMGFQAPRPRVDASYRTWFAMVSVPKGSHRVSLRYEDFRTRDGDEFRVPDGSDEDGDAWTLAYWLSVAGQHRIGAEVLRISSERAARESIGEAAAATEWLLQLNLRLQF